MGPQKQKPGATSDVGHHECYMDLWNSMGNTTIIRYGCHSSVIKTNTTCNSISGDNNKRSLLKILAES